ncbi:M48 family metalloprotease [Streptomyces actinomycinicus]|uniref:M48 family metalloprotease n=1 Tax=Streptomyces actinomycinicus TaxID=1695166 RepID=A0A937EMG2_9ACTN|nr:M48 family metalloprotease [Streptomyces actinomycinicus]MBL1084629.1 M48 family metalloprotease [Streptomyces actinomycinicus]
MTVLLLLPLLLPCALPALARRALDRLTPAVALWAVAGCAVLLAGCSVLALGVSVLTGLLKLPLFAALGELVLPLRTASAVFVVPAAAASAGALAVCGWALVRSARHQTRAFRAARAEARGATAAGDVCVVDSPRADAYALPGRPHRVVVTTAMLRTLDGPEREALFAHERAHLQGGHHYFLAAAELAAHCHPALRAVRGTIRLAAERAADEAAAASVGDRRTTARAVARAALAAQAARSARPGVAPGAAGGPVPQRVQALLAAPRAPRAGRAIATLLVACTALSCIASATAAADVHHRVEVAQGDENP